MLYLSAAELAVARQNLTGEFNPSSCNIQKNRNLKCEGKEIVVDMNGTKPKSGKIEFSNNKATATLTFDSFTATKNENGKIEISKTADNEEIVEEKPCTWTDSDSSNGYSAGDVVTCGTESFYVLDGSNTSAIQLIAMKNITIETNPRQSDSATKIAFSDSVYWLEDPDCDYYEDECSFKPKYTNGYVYDENSNLYPYMTKYESYLKNDLKVSSARVTLLDDNGIDDSNLLEGDEEDSWGVSWASSFEDFWTGTAISWQNITYKYYISMLGRDDTFYNEPGYIRPILIISSTDIE